MHGGRMKHCEIFRRANKSLSAEMLVLVRVSARERACVCAETFSFARTGTRVKQPGFISISIRLEMISERM